jgi:hypothetical protein
MGIAIEDEALVTLYAASEHRGVNAAVRVPRRAYAPTLAIETDRILDAGIQTWTELLMNLIASAAPFGRYL